MKAIRNLFFIIICHLSKSNDKGCLCVIGAVWCAWFRICTYFVDILFSRGFYDFHFGKQEDFDFWGLEKLELD
jgi:hypothetical protein